MASCTSCGHQLGVGRFCTSCGASVDPSTPDGTPVSTPVTPPPSGEDWRTDTAERKLPRPPVDARTPPAAVAPPPPPRYPLFADEVEGWSDTGSLVTHADPDPQPDPAGVVRAEAPVEPEPLDDGYAYTYADERRSPVLWIVATVVVLLLVAAGWWFLVRDDGTDSARDDGGGSAQGPGGAPEQGPDVAGRATAEAPETAPPNEDVNGDQVSYDASNMLDGVPETAWRAPGSAKGLELTFTLREPAELVRVGIINGYAKSSTDGQGREFDWYLGNRRVKAVVWTFDDGSRLRQQLEDDRGLQYADLEAPVSTGTVVLRLVGVTAPGTGPARRDYTAVSEVSLISAPA